MRRNCMRRNCMRRNCMRILSLILQFELCVCFLYPSQLLFQSMQFCFQISRIWEIGCCHMGIYTEFIIMLHIANYNRRPVTFITCRLIRGDCCMFTITCECDTGSCTWRRSHHRRLGSLTRGPRLIRRRPLFISIQCITSSTTPSTPCNILYLLYTTCTPCTTCTTPSTPSTCTTCTPCTNCTTYTTCSTCTPCTNLNTCCCSSFPRSNGNRTFT